MKTLSTLIAAMLLGGCTPAVAQYQEVLDAYSANASSSDLEPWLAGSALHQAAESRQLLETLGWQQLGLTEFTETSVKAESLVLSCLDVSDVSFVDSAGLEVDLHRAESRLLMQIQFTKQEPLKLLSIEQVGTC